MCSCNKYQAINILNPGAYSVSNIRNANVPFTYYYVSMAAQDAGSYIYRLYRFEMRILYVMSTF